VWRYYHISGRKSFRDKDIVLRPKFLGVIAIVPPRVKYFGGKDVLLRVKKILGKTVAKYKLAGRDTHLISGLVGTRTGIKTPMTNKYKGHQIDKVIDQAQNIFIQSFR
jgi:hypothetical protein